MRRDEEVLEVGGAYWAPFYNERPGPSRLTHMRRYLDRQLLLSSRSAFQELGEDVCSQARRVVVGLILKDERQSMRCERVRGVSETVIRFRCGAVKLVNRNCSKFHI